jgi:hypothetical protein
MIQRLLESLARQGLRVRVEVEVQTALRWPHLQGHVLVYTCAATAIGQRYVVTLRVWCAALKPQRTSGPAFHPSVLLACSLIG